MSIGSQVASRSPLFPTLDELGIGFVAYSPLGRGFLTGAAQPAGAYDETDMRRTDPRWQPGNYEKNVDAVRRLGDLAAVREILPTGGFGARYAGGRVPTWV